MHGLQEVALGVRRELAERVGVLGRVRGRSGPQQRGDPDQGSLGVLLALQQQRRDDVVDTVPGGYS